MGKWLQWIVLTSLTGSPILSLGILTVVWWSFDRFTFQLLPDPLKGFSRWQRSGRLRTIIANNPHDRRARAELADILLQQRRYQAAFDVLEPSYEAGDEDNATLFALGVAARGAGQTDIAIRLLSVVQEDEPNFRLGAPSLQLAHAYLGKEAWAEAEAMLRAHLALRAGSVEARVLLARVRAAQGDAESAQRLRDEAWEEHVSSPAFHRRSTRWWAWRAKPARPAMYLAAAAVAMTLFGLVVRQVIVETFAPPIEEEWVDPEL